MEHLFFSHPGGTRIKNSLTNTAVAIGGSEKSDKAS